MPRYHVAYLVPVFAIVEMDEVGNGTVTKVVEDVDHITLDEDTNVLREGDESASEEEADAAIEIAENSSWPAWDRGW